LKLTFDIPKKTVSGTVTHTFKNSTDLVLAPERTVTVLNAVGFLDLIVTGAKGLDYLYDGKELTLKWDSAFEPQEKRQVTISYKVIDPVAGLYFDVPKPGFPDRVLHAITDHETERCRYWIPCVDFPTVRTTLHFEITAPSHMQAFANGELVSVKKLENGLSVTEYSCKAPCPSYLLCVAVGELISIKDEPVNGVPIEYIAPKNYSTLDLTRSFGRTPKMFDWIQKKFDMAIPWPKYYQIGEIFGHGNPIFFLQ
jgi:aminopeptidase N